MPISFVKASACGNDFLIVEGLDFISDLSTFTRAICDRHNGVGADGVEWIFPDPAADARIRLLNADGGEAEISGNGTRCVAAYLVSELAAQGRSGLARPQAQELKIRTGAGIKTCRLRSSNGMHFEFESAMGEPQIGGAASIKLGNREAAGVLVSMGNPHFVLFVDDFSPRWQAEAAEIGSYQEFKQGMNVEYVKVIDPGNIEVRFYERGVGETQSSGTGSCASGVASIFTGRAQSPVQVHAPGGVQTVRWDKLHSEVFLTGPAQLICTGEYMR
ncbi:MAG TPA: diaminopimelate epimerase [Terriglobales bacterium]|nr:diaminopimelate epimerase [Terriglobales bacterium]